MRTELPQISHRDALNEVYVDSTPDGGYALRLLRAHRRRCDCCWIITGPGSEAAAALFEHMNRDQEQRAAELDRAISLLEAVPAGTVRGPQAAPSPEKPAG